MSAAAEKTSLRIFAHEPTPGACVDDACAPCEGDSQCEAGEACILNHCVPHERVACRRRADCTEGGLCLLSGYSSGVRGNEDMHAYCAASSGPSERGLVEQASEITEPPGVYEQRAVTFDNLLERARGAQ